MSVIVQTGSRLYAVAMTVALLRLTILLALVLMPFGMAGTAAVAQPAAASHEMAQNGHCNGTSDQDQVPAHSPQQMHCAMCAALPAGELSEPDAGLRPVMPRVIATVAPFDGIELEIATPPPKLG